MKTETKERIKLALRRFALRWLRKAFDAIEDRLHAAEVRLREDLTSGVVPVRQSRHESTLVADSEISSPDVGLTVSESVGRKRETFTEWEARRSGVATVSKKRRVLHHRRRRAADFDARFEPQPKRKDYLQ